jgi:hypothetical protein
MLSNQETIISNQQSILENRRNWTMVVGEPERILANQKQFFHALSSKQGSALDE